MKEKTQVADIDRSPYDFRNGEADAYKVRAGLTPEIVEKISKEKHDPEWMTLFRLQSLQIYHEMQVPDWGPAIDGLDMDNIVTYVRPNTKMSAKWSDVPQDIKDTFERLGIPQAERKSLAGVGAQYDSELVYHNVREEVAAQGVVYTDLESAMHGEYADMIRKHFMKLVRPNDHKFAALHGAVWSGGSFVYVPPHVSVTIPLQSYFRLNAPGAGQFEHTLILVDEGADLHFIEGCSAPKYNVANLHAGCVELFVGKNAHLRYSTIENWSKNMYNLNTKRATVEEGGTMEWVSGSFGSHFSYLYPMTPGPRWSMWARIPPLISTPSPSPRMAGPAPSAARWSSARTPPGVRRRCPASPSCWTTAPVPTPSPPWMSAPATPTWGTRPRSAGSATTWCSTSCPGGSARRTPGP